jgi:hypothetical protein
MAKRNTHPTTDLLLTPLATAGGTVAVWDRAADVIRLGGNYTDAAVRVGVAKFTFADWLRQGARLVAGVASGGIDAADLDAHQRGLVNLVEAVDRAESEAKLVYLGLLDRVARGQDVRVVTVKVDAQGQEIERSERTEQRGPDAATIRWRLERRWPEEFAPRVRAEITGADGGPVEVDVATRAAELAEELRRHLTNGQATGAGAKSS